MSDSEDDQPQLSVQALAALQQFYTDQAAEDQKLEQALSGDVSAFNPQEDWRLSQFWYDDHTATVLANEAIQNVGKHGRIACLCSPTAYRRIHELKPYECEVKLFEYDRRFEVYGTDFVFYDYSQPLEVPKDMKNTFDLVLADPPFLSEECLCKTAETIKYLAKDKILLCTGAVMEGTIKSLLGLDICKFIPKHEKQLQNEFRCYTNYHAKLLT